jgi:hypothetical protein
MTEDDGWIKAERAHEREMAEMMNRNNRDRRAHRNEMIGYIATAVAITLSVAALVAGIYAWQHDAGKRGQQLELACIEAGGTWTQIGGGNASKVCVHIAEVPK